MSKLRIVSGGLVMAAALFMTTHRASATVLSPVSGGLFVGLDGSSALLDTDNKVKVWYDQIGSVDSEFQDYGRQTAASRPTLPNVQMPNGTFHNVVDFGAGVTIYLESKLGTNARITDASSTFNAGADSAYNNQTMSWFFVYRQTGSATDARAVWRGNHDAPTSSTDYGSFIESTTNNSVLSVHGRDTSSIRRIDVAPESGHRTDWYIVAATLDTNSDVLTFKLLREDGTLFTPANQTGALAALGNHVLSRLGGTTSSNSSGALDGQIAEMLLYNTVLTSNEVDNVVGYLNNKYFVPEPSSFILTGMALLGMGCVYRRKRRS